MRCFKFLVIFSLLLTTAHAKIVEKVVAIVNDEIITLIDISEFKSKLKSSGVVDDFLSADPKELLSDRKKLVDYLINERIMDSEIKRLNLEITIERVEQEIRGIAKRNRISRNQLKEALKQQGMRFSDYQDLLKNRLERQALIEREITSKIKVSDEDVMSYYLKNEKITGEENFEYKLAHIFVSKSSDGTKKGREKISSALNKLNSGASFETVAAQFSEDPNFSSGGLLGVFKTGEMTPAMEKEAKKTDVNDFSGIITTPTSYHIIKVLNKKIIADPKFEAAKEKVRSILFQQAFKRQFDIWLERKKSDSFIRINS